MKAVRVMADVVFFGDMELKGDLIGMKEFPFDVFHFYPIRDAVFSAYRYMVPSLSGGCYDAHRRSIDRRLHEKSPARFIAN